MAKKKYSDSELYYGVTKDDDGNFIDIPSEDRTSSEKDSDSTDNTGQASVNISENNKSKIDARNLPKILCDTTAAIEISASATDSLEEIIKDARKIIVPYKLLGKDWYNGDESIFLNESREVVYQLWRRANHLTFHYATFFIQILFDIGEVLTFVENYFTEKYPDATPKKKYTSWLNANFGIQHGRLFQQAKNLYEMGEFARDYACIGKNRLLDLYRIMKSLEKEHTKDNYEELLTEFPLYRYDIADEFEETGNKQKYKTLVDACINKKRLKELDVDVTNEQAELMALYKRTYITYDEAIEIKDKLKEYGEGAKFKKAFDEYIFNKMSFRTDEIIPANPHSISKRLITFVKYIDKIQDKFKDPVFFDKQKRYLVGEKKLFINARKTINKLIKDFGWGK